MQLLSKFGIDEVVKVIPNYVYGIFSGFAVLYAIRKIRESQWGWCRNNVRLEEHIAIVTGPTSGIGYEVAKDLWKRGARVVLGCRNVRLGWKAVEKMIKEFPSLDEAKLDVMQLDLTDLVSVTRFANAYRSKYFKLDILVNNAGVAYPNDVVGYTAQGYELHFGVNHLAHFYLTKSLMGELQRSEFGARVVVVSSATFVRGSIDFDNFKPLNYLDVRNRYADSKLANFYFARELAKRTKDKHGSNGHTINVYTVCPGLVYTRLFRHYNSWKHFITFGLLMLLPAYLFMRSPRQGAQTIMYCITDPFLKHETGLCYKDFKKYAPKKFKLEEDVQERLWEDCEKMIDNFYETHAYKLD